MASRPIRFFFQPFRFVYSKNDYLSQLLVDGKDLTISKNRIYLTRHQKNMISVYKLLLRMLSILIKYL